MARHVFGILLLAVSASACGTSATYIPEQRATATLGGRTAAAYPLPSSQNHQGDLRVASFGVTELKRDSEEVPAIHLRLALADNGTQPIELDIREQRLQLPDGRFLAPASFAEKSVTQPLIVVAPGSSRNIDLFFPLPDDLTDDETPPQFDVVWRLRVGGQPMSRITPFDKVDVDPALARQELAEDIWGSGGGPYWVTPATGGWWW